MPDARRGGQLGFHLAGGSGGLGVPCLWAGYLWALAAPWWPSAAAQHRQPLPHPPAGWAVRACVQQAPGARLACGWSTEPLKRTSGPSRAPPVSSGVQDVWGLHGPFAVCVEILQRWARPGSQEQAVPSGVASPVLPSAVLAHEFRALRPPPTQSPQFRPPPSWPVCWRCQAGVGQAARGRQPCTGHASPSPLPPPGGGTRWPCLHLGFS